MKKHIVILSNHFITLFRFRRELIERLLKEGHRVTLCLPPSTENLYFEQLGCEIIMTNMDRRGLNPLKDLKLLIHYIWIFFTLKPDLVFSYTIKPNVYGSIASMAAGTRQICNVTGTGATFLGRGPLKALAILLYKISTRYSYRVFFQNEGDRGLFRKHGMVDHNDRRIPGSGVNLDEFETSTYPSGDVIRFLYAGRIMKLKGVDELLEVARRLEGDGLRCKITLAGFIEESIYDPILHALPADGVLEYVGFQKNIGDWIQNSHCIVLPSHGGEGVPNVVLEAAAMGRPAIVSEVNGSTEVVECGESGFHFKPGDSDDLYQQMKQFIQMPQERRIQMGLNGRKLVEDRFDRNKVIEIYMNEVGACESASMQV